MIVYKYYVEDPTGKDALALPVEWKGRTQLGSNRLRFFVSGL